MENCGAVRKNGPQRGQQLGVFTLYTPIPGKIRDRRQVWLARCVCGNFKEVVAAEAKKRKSCGTNCPNYTGGRPVLDRPAGSSFGHWKSSARLRGEITLLRDEWIAIISGDCHYCGVEAAPRNQVDRLEPGRAYSKDNCVPACRQCNVMKWDYTEAEFRSHVLKLASRVK